MKEGQFEKYVGLIRKSAQYYSNLWHVEYDDVEAQGFLIYWSYLNDFDKSLGYTFSTFLSWKLKKLNDYCKTVCRQRCILIEDMKDSENVFNESLIDVIPDHRNNLTLAELLENATDELSEKAYAVFKYILERSWEDEWNRSTPPIKDIMNKFNCTRAQYQKIFEEIKKYYNSSNFIQFKSYNI